MFSSLSVEATRILKEAYPELKRDVLWDVPREADHGDATTTIALQLSKLVGQPPKDVAETLSSALQKSFLVEKVEIAGPGYVNVWLTPEALLQELKESRTSHTAKVKRKEDPVIIEYSQPNIAKPLGIHHILSTVIGQALSNLYSYQGFPVVSWNYIGDYGTQFGKLAVAHQKWGKKKSISDYTLDKLLDLYVKFHDEAEKDESLEEEAREAFRKLEQGDKELRDFWEGVVAVTKSSLKDLYERLHVSFDVDLGESFYEDKMESIIEEGKKKRVFVEGENGALIVKFADENMPPYLILKGDGATLYSTRDIAQMRYRIDTYNPQAIYILTDIAQKLHFEQLIETCKMLGWELPEFENVLFGRMRFADKKMSTRKGNILKLEHVLDEAVKRADEVIKEHGETIQTDDREDLKDMMGIGAVVYGILSQNRKMDMVFDWDKMLSFEGNSAPYLQYTHARAKSVLRKATQEGMAITIDQIESFTRNERRLLCTLLLFPDVLEEARTTHMPHKLANFLYQLCQDFNAFYNVDPILKAPDSARALRLLLTADTATVLKVGAELLTLRVPDRM